MKAPQPTRLSLSDHNRIVQRLLANPNFALDVVRSESNPRLANPELARRWLNILQEILDADDTVRPGLRDWMLVVAGIAMEIAGLAMCDFQRLDAKNLIGSGISISGALLAYREFHRMSRLYLIYSERAKAIAAAAALLREYAPSDGQPKELP